MANGKLKRLKLTEEIEAQKRHHQLLRQQSELKKQEYHSKVNSLKEVKEKYQNELFKIDGVFGVGLRVYEEKIKFG
jgi:NAD(P)H-hydrate repair Nnr-like enzyme with NAD(P)H-hydrate epimerase domain